MPDKDSTPRPDPEDDLSKDGASGDGGEAPEAKEGETETDRALPDDQQAMQPDSS